MDVGTPQLLGDRRHVHSNLVTSALRPVFDFLGRTVFSTPQIASNERIMKRSKPSTPNSATCSGPCPISNLPTEAHLSHRSPAEAGLRACRVAGRVTRGPPQRPIRLGRQLARQPGPLPIGGLHRDEFLTGRSSTYPAQRRRATSQEVKHEKELSNPVHLARALCAWSSGTSRTGDSASRSRGLSPGRNRK